MDQFNYKICRLCAKKHTKGYALFTANSENCDRIVKTICGFVEKSECTNLDLHAKWLCTSCHSAGTAAIEFLYLISKGQQELKEFAKELKLKKADLEENEILQAPTDVYLMDKNKVGRIQFKKRHSPAKMHTSTTASSADKSLYTTLECNKRLRRPPKRLLDEINGKVYRTKKCNYKLFALSRFPLQVKPFLHLIDIFSNQNKRFPNQINLFQIKSTFLQIDWPHFERRLKGTKVYFDLNYDQNGSGKPIFNLIHSRFQHPIALPIVITTPKKEIDSSTLITSESIAEIRSAAGEALGEVIGAISDGASEVEASCYLKTYFICEYCKEAFSKRYDFLQHIATHENCIYECSACLQNFQSKCTFDEHQAETGHLGCGIIEFAAAAKDADAFAAPINIFVGTNGQITSIIGEEINDNNGSLHGSDIKNELKSDQHITICRLDKNDSKPLKNVDKKLDNSMYACLHCSKTFDNHYSVRRHYQLVHVAIRPYKCEMCAASFKTKYILNVHRATHTGEKRHSCNFCKKNFITKHAWKIHTRIHTGERPYKCTDCLIVFANRGNLMLHRRVHTGERPYKCDCCELCFKSIGNLKHHKKMHLKEAQQEIKENNKPVIQNVVILPPYDNLSKTTTNNISLNNNVNDTIDMIESSMEEPTKDSVATNTFPCAVVATHSNSAVDSKATYRFRCSVCFKQFNQCSAFNKHRRTHSGERPYRCHMCPKAFADPSNFKKHKMLHKNATYALKIESEKQKMQNLRQIMEDQSLDVTFDAAAINQLSPTSAISDPDPDGLEVLQRLNARRRHSSLSNDSISVDLIDLNIGTERVGLNKERFITWNTFDCSLLKPKIISTLAVAESTTNKLPSCSNTFELSSTSPLAADDSKQVICISYQDPTNPVGKKTTTYYAIN